MIAGKAWRFLVFVFALLIFYPIAVLFVESLRAEGGSISLEPLRSLLLTSRQLGLMKTSLTLAAGTTLFSLLMGVGLAFLLKRTDLPLRNLFNYLYILPLALPPYLQAIVWTKFFSSDQGILHWPSIFGIPGGVFVYTLCFFPFVTLIASSGLQSINPSLEEASLSCRNPLATIRGITLPLITPHITSGAILVFVFTLVNFEVADILRLKVYPVEIFIHFSALYNERTATLLSVPLISLAMALIWGQMALMRDKSYANLESIGRGRDLFRLGSWKPFVTALVGGTIGISLLIPLYVIFRGAGSVENYVKALESTQDQIVYSLWVAAGSATVMVAFSFGASYYLERGRGILRRALDFLIQTPFGLPSIVMGIGLIRAWNHPGLDFIYDSSAILIMGLVAGYAPFVMKVFSSKIKQIPVEWEEAALLATSRRRAIVQKILLPLSMPAVMTGFLIGFILSLSNLGTALLVTAPGRATLPIKVYNFMHYGAEEIVFASNLLLLGLIAFAVAAFHLGFRRIRGVERR